MAADTRDQLAVEPLFFYAEECDLALFQHRRTGKRFCLDRENFRELAASICAGWQPGRD